MNRRHLATALLVTPLLGVSVASAEPQTILVIRGSGERTSFSDGMTRGVLNNTYVVAIGGALAGHQFHGFIITPHAEQELNTNPRAAAWFNESVTQRFAPGVPTPALR